MDTGDNSDIEVDARLETSSPDGQAETKHYDVALLFAETDKHRALEILDEMEQLTLVNEEKPKVCLYTDLPGTSSHIDGGKNLTKVATLIIVLATENLQDAEVARLIKDEAIGNTRLARKCHPGLKFCVRPLYLERARKDHPPSGLSTITPVEWYDKDSKFFQRNIRMLLEYHIPYRKQREREYRRQRRNVGNSSTQSQDVPDVANIAVSVQPAHQQSQESDLPSERSHLDSNAAVRLSSLSHHAAENLGVYDNYNGASAHSSQQNEAMATPNECFTDQQINNNDHVGLQSLDTIDLNNCNNTNGPSVQSRSTNESSGFAASGKSTSEGNNNQSPDSAMAKRKDTANNYMNPSVGTHPPGVGESYVSQDGVSKNIDNSPNMNTPENRFTEEERNLPLQTSGLREEQGPGTRNTLLSSGSETDDGSIVESDLMRDNLITDTSFASVPNRDSQNTTDQIYTRDSSSDSEPTDKNVPPNYGGKGTESTQTTESLLAGANGKHMTADPLNAHVQNKEGATSLVQRIEHGTMTEQVLTHRGQAHTRTARCAAPNDPKFVDEPYGVVEPRVVHYHTHYHSEVHDSSQGGLPQQRRPGAQGNLNWRTEAPITVIGCSNVQIGANQRITGSQAIPETSPDIHSGSDASTTIHPESPPPPYSIADPNQRCEHPQCGGSQGHEVFPESIQGGFDETTHKQLLNSEAFSQDGRVSEKTKPQTSQPNKNNNPDWLQENEPVNTDGGSSTPVSGDEESGFADARVQSPGVPTSDANLPSGAPGGRSAGCDLSEISSLLVSELGPGDDLLQMLDRDDEEDTVSDASDKGSTSTSERLGRNKLPRRKKNLRTNPLTPTDDTINIPSDVFCKDSRRAFVYTEAGKQLLKDTCIGASPDIHFSASDQD
ncbi:uncharacterized protein LOC124126241 isoform X2 [Haliotis rufescens]|uniref:uncharacterized protein LOC124126241 isoform X2 n=1 Tax=Haliotis rufescens TaxID=6454 RepID=UPI00201F0239|nr:uncharacterized protein LOC124126241 isoform X2 [Haliotis rufescens]